ncbi:helix-turn-helix transcriptional regulator [Exiguobacterium sp. B2(2022)]|uniref:helix-turn-helix transcriptional regulator n=1 Tax=Exiguobacterium sp. B2(2022) TaxID=2992755 RepID=UPI00237B7ED3|nr:helix-turn-helix domain-containing protein [Exiguobacterium sp. B2(2022)]MDE0564160.1 helix-turn-helix domain-containing protein [Exiguobacterium sp. B2(2022)]
MQKSEFIGQVSRKMKLIRIESQHSQDEMASLLGISKKTLIQIEKERNEASWSTVVTLCALFNESEILIHLIGDDPVEFVKTLGGRVFWHAIESGPHFILQQNIISGHYRIIDLDHVRWYSTFDAEDAEHVRSKLEHQREVSDDTKA